MTFCPNCREEYRPGFTRCKDCDVELVESLPEEMPEERGGAGSELVELAVFNDIPEAEMIKELLEDNGIVTMLRGEADPIGVASGAEPSTLLVSRADLPQARRIYEEYFAGEQGEEESGQEGDDQDEQGGPGRRGST